MKKVRLGLFLFLISGTALFSLAAIDKTTLEIRHARAVSDSADALNNLSDLSLVGSVEKYGMRGGIGIFYERPNRFALTLDFPTTFEKHVLSGNNLLLTELSGRYVELTGLFRRDERVLQFILGLQYLNADYGNMDSLTEAGEVIETRYVTSDGFPVQIVFDADNYLIRSFSFTSTLGYTREFIIKRFRSVSGLVIPTIIQENSVNPAEYTFSDIYVNQGIPSGRFDNSPKPFSLTIPERGWGRLPVDQYFGLPLVKAWIGDSPALTFLVDLNLPFSVIDENIASQLGINSSGKISFPMRYPASDFSITRIPNFLLREIEFKNKVFMCCNMLPTSINVQMPIHGIIGCDLLYDLVVTLDLPKDQMFIFDPKSFAYDDLGERVALIPNHYGYSVACRMEGVDVYLEIATSLADSLLLTEPSYAARVIRDRRRASVAGHSDGLQYGVPENIYRVRNISLASIDLPDTFVHVAEYPAANVLSKTDRGWLGCGLLRRFVLNFDFPKSTLYLKANDRFNMRDSFNSVGLYVVKSGQSIVVQHVVDDLPAGQAGIKVGDTVLQINQIPTENMVFDRIYESFRLNPDEKLSLKLKRGEEEIDVQLEGSGKI
ncbi:MAG: PDZ domain-containing protein [Acidobacteria bacterium]|nr:PDZ domain-containing protein [Acidobacteriota bacterium]